MNATTKKPMLQSRSNALRQALEDIDACTEQVIAQGQKEADKLDDDGSGAEITTEYVNEALMKAGIGNEDFVGGMLGGVQAAAAMVISIFGNTPAGFLVAAGSNAAFNAAVQKKEKEIKALSESIAKAATAEGRKLIREGKLDKDTYEEHVESISPVNVFLAALGGAVPGLNIVLLILNRSDLGDRVKELKKKQRELAAIIADTKSNAANESADGQQVPAEGQVDPNAAPAAAPAATQAPADGQPPVPAAPAAVNPAPAGDPVGQLADGVAQGAGTPSAKPDATGPGAAAVADNAAAPGVAAPGDNPAGDAAAAAAAGADAAAQNTEAAVAADTAEAQATQDELAEAGTTQVAMESFQREMVLLGKAAYGLENLAEMMRSTKQVGGPTPHAALMYSAGVEAICDMATLARPLNLGLEAMEGADDRIDGAEKQANSAKGLARRIYEAMKAGLARFGQWMANLWKLTTSAAARTLARAKSLQASVESAQFSTEAISGGPAGVVKDTGKFVSAFPAATQLVTHFNTPATYSAYIELLAATTKLELGGEEAAANLQQYNALLTKVRTEFGQGMASAEKDGTIELTKPWVGDQQLKIVLPTTVEKVSAFATTIAPVEGASATKVEQVKAVTQAEAKALLKSVVDGLTFLSQNTTADGLKGVDEKLNTSMNAFKNKQAPAENASGKIMKFLSDLVASRSRLPAYVLNRSYVGVCTSAVALVGASIKGAEKQPAGANVPANTAPAAAA